MKNKSQLVQIATAVRSREDKNRIIWRLVIFRNKIANALFFDEIYI